MQPYAMMFFANPKLAQQALNDTMLARHIFETMPEAPYHPSHAGLPGAGLGLLDDITHKPCPLWTCHVLTRLILKRGNLALPWVVKDGRFNGGYQHSWLELNSQGYQLMVLDVYPWASFTGPSLLDMTSLSPWRTLFSTEEPEPDSSQREESFEREANIAVTCWDNQTSPDI